jgi:hypothetical protein
MTGTFNPLGGRIQGGNSYPDPAEYIGHELPEVGPDPVVVGVVDTGLVPHPWLGDHVRFNRFVDDDPLPSDGSDPTQGSTGHGTFVSGLILIEAPNAVVTMKGVLNKTTGALEDHAVAAAIEDLRLAGVQLINLSFGGDSNEVGLPPVIEQALLALPPETVVVVSAGNSASEKKFYPAAADLGIDHATVVSVGATDTSGRVAGFSNRGWVTLYAPGVDRHGPYLDYAGPTREFTGWARWSGTSFASAVVTGRIANKAAEGKSIREAYDDIYANANDIETYGVNGPAAAKALT